MSTFKSKTSDQAMTIESGQSTLSPVIHATVCLAGDPISSIYLDPAEAPAIALAVMEAGAATIGALYDYDSAAHAYYEAMNWLTTARDRAEKETAADAEAAELEAEARELLRAFTLLGGMWGALHENHRERWIAAALRARELATERNTK